MCYEKRPFCVALFFSRIFTRRSFYQRMGFLGGQAQFRLAGAPTSPAKPKWPFESGKMPSVRNPDVPNSESRDQSHGPRRPARQNVQRTAVLGGPRAAAEKAVDKNPQNSDVYAVYGEALGQWANEHKGLHSLKVVVKRWRRQIHRTEPQERLCAHALVLFLP